MEFAVEKAIHVLREMAATIRGLERDPTACFDENGQWVGHSDSWLDTVADALADWWTNNAEAFEQEAHVYSCANPLCVHPEDETREQWILRKRVPPEDLCCPFCGSRKHVHRHHR